MLPTPEYAFETSLVSEVTGDDLHELAPLDSLVPIPNDLEIKLLNLAVDGPLDQIVTRPHNEPLFDLQLDGHEDLPAEIPLVTVQGADHEGGLVILLDVPRFPVGHVGFPLPHAAKDEFIFFRVKWCPPSEGLIF